jgi:hypothetical protein
MLEAASKIIAARLNIKSMPSGIIRLNGKVAKPESLITTALPLLTPEDRKALSDLGIDPYNHNHSAGVYNALAKPVRDLSGVTFNDVIDTPMTKLQFIINAKNTKKCFLYCEETDWFDDYPFDFVRTRASQVLGKEEAPKWAASNSLDCDIGYNPNETRIFWPSESKRVFNLYRHPAWRQGWAEPTKAPAIPSLIKDFLQALLPEKADQTTVAAWLRDATFARAEPILVLSGSPGVGKNILIEHVAAALVGNPGNYRSATRAFGKSYFHNNVSQCRLFFLDEMNLTHDARESLKSYHNGVGSIERKGVDAGDPEKIFASFAIANNYPQYIKLEYSDRKFYVPQLTTTPLRDSLGQTKIDELLTALRSDDFLRDFAAYLFAKFRPGQSARFKKNETFRQLCLNSYPPWFQRFIKAAHENTEISSKKFNRGIHRKADAQELQQQIDHYRVNFGKEIATLKADGPEWLATSLVYANGAALGEDFEAPLHA